jgi:hypothetical protein
MAQVRAGAAVILSDQANRAAISPTVGDVEVAVGTEDYTLGAVELVSCGNALYSH